MPAAARSLTEPPGLKYSALPKISIPRNSFGIFSRRSRGVLPMVASRGSASVRARWGTGRTSAIATFSDSFRGLNDAKSRNSLSQQRLYHRPNVANAGRGGGWLLDIDVTLFAQATPRIFFKQTVDHGFRVAERSSFQTHNRFGQ